MHRFGLVARLLVVLALVACLPAVLPPAGAGATDVHGDDEADRYVGTGGLILPGSMASGTRTEVASCLGCEWRLTSPCVPFDAGSPFSGSPTCMSVVRGCPGMGELLRGWFHPQSGPWRELGMVCIRPGGPSTVVEVAGQVEDRLSAVLPAPRPSFQPARGVVTQLPVIFDSGQRSTGMTAELEIVGQSVVIVAEPTWRWEFGDGTGQSVAVPGGRYPNMAVAHVYRNADAFRVRMVASWSARFTVDGIGPFPIAEPVSQTASLLVRVGEGRAVLTTH